MGGRGEDKKISNTWIPRLVVGIEDDGCGKTEYK